MAIESSAGGKAVEKSKSDGGDGEEDGCGGGR